MMSKAEEPPEIMALRRVACEVIRELESPVFEFFRQEVSHRTGVDHKALLRQLWQEHADEYFEED